MHDTSLGNLCEWLGTAAVLAGMLAFCLLLLLGLAWGMIEVTEQSGVYLQALAAEARLQP